MVLISIIKFFLVFIISMSLGLSGTIEAAKIFSELKFEILIMELLIFITYRIYSKCNSKSENVIDIVTPHIMILFFTAVINCRYGYGNTFGILRYKEDCGIFTLLNVPKIACIVLVFLSFIFLCILAVEKLFLRFRNEKIFIFLLAIFETMIFAACAVLYFLRQHLFDSLMFIGLFSYFVLYFILDWISKNNVGSKINAFLTRRKKMNFKKFKAAIIKVILAFVLFGLNYIIFQYLIFCGERGSILRFDFSSSAMIVSLIIIDFSVYIFAIIFIDKLIRSKIFLTIVYYIFALVILPVLVII